MNCVRRGQYVPRVHAPPLTLTFSEEETLSACMAILPPDPAPDPFEESPPTAVTDPEPEMLLPMSHTLPPILRRPRNSKIGSYYNRNIDFQSTLRSRQH